LAKESFFIILLDTFVAIASGFIIFPACAAFGIDVDAGPSLVFITLPRVFDCMPGGIVWGTVFFVFLAIAALSTLIAVFENLVAFGIDEWKLNRVTSCIIFGAVLLVFALPCIFGFNIWSSFAPLGKGTNILDLEDFIVSENLLPLGAFFVVIFCLNRWGWRDDGFLKELSRSNGFKPGRIFIFYMRWIIPPIVLLIWVIGLLKRFFPELL
jgi:NSS family neurotransmitter:Na+ symporter